jgi:hypothetical protein
MPVAHFDVSPPLSSITPLLPEAAVTDEVVEPPELATGLEGEPGPQDLDAAVQDFVGAGEIPSPLLGFNSLPNLSGVAPPDPVGDVGPNPAAEQPVLSNPQQIRGVVGDRYSTILLWVGFWRRLPDRQLR